MGAPRCAICTRIAVGGIKQGRYCVYHSQAYEGLLAHYKTWISAYGELPWQQYLERIVKMNETGEWIKDIATAELKKGKEK